jgi:hypothetical protein
MLAFFNGASQKLQRNFCKKACAVESDVAMHFARERTPREEEVDVYGILSGGCVKATANGASQKLQGFIRWAGGESYCTIAKGNGLLENCLEKGRGRIMNGKGKVGVRFMRRDGAGSPSASAPHGDSGGG